MANSNNEFYQNSLINARKDNDEWKNAVGTCSADMIEKTITENGQYTAKEDGVVGYSKVNVDVSASGKTQGLPKLATPTNIAKKISDSSQLWYIPAKNSKYMSPAMTFGQGPTAIPKYVIFSEPIQYLEFIYAVSQGGYDTYCYVLFTAKTDTITAKYINSIGNTSSITMKNSGSVTTGKLYLAKFYFEYNGSATALNVRNDELTECNEPVSFTLI